MRYSVFFKKAGGEKTCVFNTMSPDLTLALINPKVHLAADSAGTFECSLNPNSPAMPESVLERMATKVMVEEYSDHVPNDGSIDENNNEKVLFYGRVLSIDSDFYNTPSLYCEGAYSFLNDTVIMPYTMPKKNGDDTYFTPKQALQKFLREHNDAVTRAGQNFGIKFETDTSKMIVTMKDDLFSGEKNDGSGKEIENFVVETYTNTREVFENLKKTYGGHFRVRYRKVLQSEANDYPDQMAVPILDWIADYNDPKQGTNADESEAYIEFGTNLLDLTQKKDGSNIVNCLFLTGKKITSAGNETIGDEIDVAPMCYYWMVKDNGDDADGSLVTSNQNAPISDTNVHDLRYFVNVREGAYYRNPKSLRELVALNDTDMSHVYHITNDPDNIENNGWWVYNHNTDTPGIYVGVIKLSSLPHGLPQEEEIVAGNAVRVRSNDQGYSPEKDVIIRNEWNASSRGLAWVHGCAINNIGGDEQIRYELASASEYSCTGFFDSTSDRPSWVPDGDYGSLRVFPNEVYYYSTWCASDPNRDPPLRTVVNITTKNHLRTGAAVIVDSSTAGAGGSSKTFTKFTVPTPAEDNQALFLNFSGKSNVQPGRPKTRSEVGIQLWRSRKPVYDEYITLWGIAGGNQKWYLENEKYTDQSTGRELTRTVLRVPKRVDQLLIGTSDKDQYFIYPKEQNVEYVEYYDTYDDFPSEGNTGTYYVDRSTGDVWTYDQTWVGDLNHHAYKVNSYGVEDPDSIAKYGRIEKIVNFSNCTDPATLRDLGAKALFEARLEGVELNVTALDLSLLETNVKSPDVLDLITVRSTPHNVKISLPLNERDIPLNDPAQQQYSIGYTGSQKITSTHSGLRR